jgi:NADH-quinone oxidoreductase subunit D
MLEVVQSIRLVEQALDRSTTRCTPRGEAESRIRERVARRSAPTMPRRRMPLAELMKAKYSHRVEPPRTLPAGECYVETECPRGQMGFHVVGRPNKENVPLRVRARSSCFCNLSVAGELCRNCLVADVPAIIGSTDIVMGEIDR